jgi:hypothetical protein
MPMTRSERKLAREKNGTTNEKLNECLSCCISMCIENVFIKFTMYQPSTSESRDLEEETRNNTELETRESDEAKKKLGFGGIFFG